MTTTELAVATSAAAILTSPAADPHVAAPPSIAPVDAILRDGASVEIRAVTLEDRPHIGSLFARMGPSSIRHRFFAAKRELSDAELSFLVGNGSSHVALAAVVRRGGACTCRRAATRPGSS